jgi:hypothetical protein
MSGQLHAPAALTPGKKPRYPLDRTQEPAWTLWKSENSWAYRDSNSDPLVVQPVASHCTDYAIPSLYNVI